MTVTNRRSGAPRASGPTWSPCTIDGIEVTRPEGHAGDPRRRAARHPDPAVLRPPAARPGRRLPAVHRRGRGPAQAAGRRARRRSPRAWSSRPSSPPRSPRRRRAASSSCCCINHPLDCPVCDKGGECPLQNQTMTNGYGESRASATSKRTFPKPIAISAQVLLDRERCVLCARCTRFSQQIAGDPFIELFERGALEQVGDLRRTSRSTPTSPATPCRSARSARSPARSTASAPGRSTWCRRRASASTARPAASSAPTTGAARCCAGWPATTPQVNEEWNCDKGRWAFQLRHRQATGSTTPLVRDDDGDLVEASWTEALRARPRPGWRRARAAGVGVLTGGRLTVEDAYAYAKFARVALGTNDIDFRARPHSAEERGLPRRARRRPLPRDDVRRPRGRAGRAARRASSPKKSRRSSSCGCARPRRKRQHRCSRIAPFATDGSAQDSRRGCSPPSRAPRPRSSTRSPPARDALDDDAAYRRCCRRSRQPGAVILVGERLAAVARGAVGRRAAGRRHRRAAGLGAAPRRRARCGRGRLPAEPAARRPPARRRRRARRRSHRAGASTRCPTTAGRDTDRRSSRPPRPASSALVVGGVDPADLPDPALALEALENAPFVVSLELRESPSPTAPTSSSRSRRRSRSPAPTSTGRAGSGPFDATLERHRRACPTSRVLDRLAEAMDVDLGLPDVARRAAEIAAARRLAGARPAAPTDSSRPAARPQPGARPCSRPGTCCSTTAACRTREPYLAGTRKPLSRGCRRADGQEVGRRPTAGRSR